MTINVILLVVLLLAVMWTVMITRLLWSVIGLAVTSAVLSMIMFRLGAPLAAVFELSVCSGLIMVIFITTITFTQRISHERLLERQRERFTKFWFLPLIVMVTGALLVSVKIPVDIAGGFSASREGAREVMWNFRHLDLLGQIVILMAGAFGVAVLFKEKK